MLFPNLLSFPFALSLLLVSTTAWADGPSRQDQDPGRTALSVDGLVGTAGEGVLFGVKGSSTRSGDPTVLGGYMFDLKGGVVDRGVGGAFVGNIGAALSPNKYNVMLGDPMGIHSDGTHFFGGFSPLVGLGYGHVTGSGMYYFAPKLGVAGKMQSQGPVDAGLLLGGEGVYEKEVDSTTAVRLAAILGAALRGPSIGVTYTLQASASRRIKPYLGLSAGVEVSDYSLPNTDGSNTSSVSALGTLGLVLETPR